MLYLNDFIDGDKFESISDFSFGDSIKGVKELSIDTLNLFLDSFKLSRFPIIYIDSDRVLSLFDLLNTTPTKEFILVSHNSDVSFNNSDIQKPKCIVKWFGQNINFKNTEDIISLPIGLERQFWSQGRYGEYGYKHKKIYEYSQKKLEKNKVCYLNFDVNTNHMKRSWIEPFFREKNWCYIRMGGIFGDLDLYFTECLESFSILCPDGNGIDCHRNWEMLYLGTIPIIQKSFFHEEVYHDLPVILIDNFTNLTYEMIIDKYQKINVENTEYEKLKFSFWENLIKKSTNIG